MSAGPTPAAYKRQQVIDFLASHGVAAHTVQLNGATPEGYNEFVRTPQRLQELLQAGEKPNHDPSSSTVTFRRPWPAEMPVDELATLLSDAIAVGAYGPTASIAFTGNDWVIVA